MDIEKLFSYCEAKENTSHGFPFDQYTLVFKVYEKMFCLASLKQPDSCNLKCDPDYAESLRASYPEQVLPGYHMNKKHWNTVYFNGNMSEDLLLKLIDHSYELVAKGAKKVKTKSNNKE